MKKGLDQLVEEQKEYDPQSQEIIKSLAFADKEISEIDAMKRTSGWKILDKRIRDELKERIETLVKDDLKIQTLLALLKVADTKTLNKILESEIAKFLPDG